MHLGTLEQIAQAQGLSLEEVQALAETLEVKNMKKKPGNTMFVGLLIG